MSATILGINIRSRDVARGASYRQFKEREVVFISTFLVSRMLRKHPIQNIDKSAML